MAYRWVKRESYSRRLKSGKRVPVSSYWALYQTADEKKKSRRRTSCPECGALIISRRMPNGGMAHFEGRPSLSRIKHPCLHRGEGISKRRDSSTPDLFEKKEQGED